MTEEEIKQLPLYDGISHINIYSKGNTEIGRLLTNMAFVKVKIPEVGQFECLEGYWYWLKVQHFYKIKNKTKEEFENVAKDLFSMNGFKAKKYGRGLIKELELTDDDTKIIPDDFKEKIKLAIQYKIKQNKVLLNLLANSVLPFHHYYYYGKKENPTVILLPEYDWMLEEIERLRIILQNIIKSKKVKS